MPKDKPSNSVPTKTKKRHIEQYDHKDKKRINNPPIGLVTAKTDPDLPTHKIYVESWALPYRLRCTL